MHIEVFYLGFLLLLLLYMQNNLHELWALLNYLLPQVFSSADDFDRWFDSDNCLRGKDDIAKHLQVILRPFMLRRIKAEVEKSLLPKIEMKLFVGLPALQRETYKKVIIKDIQTINSMGQTSQKAINSILMDLRKAADHPYLKSQGSRVVLFSQFVIVLKLLEDYLDWRGYKYCPVSVINRKTRTSLLCPMRCTRSIA